MTILLAILFGIYLGFMFGVAVVNDFEADAEEVGFLLIWPLVLIWAGILYVWNKIKRASVFKSTKEK